ncbi:hypothetical protein BKA66DRAFT_565059 [Pyrenochaeta sp. MPI-SDFR-AT-0127]|nr:hypothetical protein BKA66DRAFT_565059 [Pyrenochaeta sp. MPI-SDFR-AT-0127]
MDASLSHAIHDNPPAPPTDDHHHHHIHIPHDLPPDYPPPSYDDATGSETAPLLVGPPPDYGAFRAYSDASSMASSEVEATDRSLPEWVGQALVVFVFVVIIYGFYRVISVPDSMDDFPG